MQVLDSLVSSIRSRGAAPAQPALSLDAWLLTLVTTNLACNILANACFKASTLSPSWRDFLGWQVVGNLAGFMTVLTLTGLLRHVPLHVAYIVTTGLAVIGVQMVAAGMIFHEPISRGQWLGAGLVIAGIALMAQR